MYLIKNFVKTYCDRISVTIDMNKAWYLMPGVFILMN